MVAIDGPGNRRPRLLDGQDALDIGVSDRFARLTVEDDWLDAKEGERGRSGFCACRTWEWAVRGNVRAEVISLKRTLLSLLERT
jgi:hypothetical protein